LFYQCFTSKISLFSFDFVDFINPVIFSAQKLGFSLIFFLTNEFTDFSSSSLFRGYKCLGFSGEILYSYQGMNLFFVYTSSTDLQSLNPLACVFASVSYFNQIRSGEFILLRSFQISFVQMTEENVLLLPSLVPLGLGFMVDMLLK